MRLAWFSPWPPDRSGVAGRSAEVVPLLAERGHGIDVFVDERRVPVERGHASAPPEPGAVRVQSAHEFIWRERRGSYDLTVYQLGNSELHDFTWPYLFRWPGLVVLHDARLHHARGKSLLARKRHAEYRVEFTWNQPGVSADAAELAIRGFAGVYYYQWPMVRSVVDSARLVACHAPAAAAELAGAYPDRSFDHIALGEGRAMPAPEIERDRRRIRTLYGLPESAIVFGVFGGLTAERRMSQILAAFAATRQNIPNVRLLLAGQPDPAVALDDQIQSLGIGDVTCRLDSVDDARFDAAIAAVDVSLNLRWPTALEMSGPWLRALAAGRPTVIVDLAHLAGVPALDPRTWRPHTPGPPSGDAPDPVAVAIDILDEDHSLRKAMAQLATDTALRRTLGAAARRYWEAHHTVDRMVGDYERVMARAASLPRSAAPVSLPAHLRPDPLAHARTIAGPSSVLAELESP
jgi:glycosyltransferase involved in cell wall biosynthesis